MYKKYLFFIYDVYYLYIYIYINLKSFENHKLISCPCCLGGKKTYLEPSLAEFLTNKPNSKIIYSNFRFRWKRVVRLFFGV